MMRAYIINLDRAPERWASVERAFHGTRFELCRIAGIDGKTLTFPHPDYSEKRFRWFHGRPTSPGHVGCYLSHVKAMQAFLATSESHALIGEDDLLLGPHFEATIEEALQHEKLWDIVRLTGLSEGRPLRVKPLGRDHWLCVGLGRLKGTGAYVVNRKAARAYVIHLLPMWLPIDHAMDREWFYGIRAAYILPFPGSQIDAGFRSLIHTTKTEKLSSLYRLGATYPYQAFNEVTRYLFRGFAYLRMRFA